MSTTDIPPAVIVTGVLVDTVVVEMSKLSVGEPGDTVTEAGTAATAGLLLATEITVPEGAPPFVNNVIVAFAV